MNTITYEHAKKSLAAAAEIMVLLAALDLLILFLSIAQVTAEGRSGYWSPFWKAQAEIAMKIIL